MILIYSHLRDPHALAVERSLREELGREVEIVDVSHFPRIIRLAAHLGNGGCEHRLRLPDGRTIRQEDVTAVWWRRPQPFQLHPEVKARHHVRFARSECSSAIHGMWMSSRCLWVNPIEADRQASRKLHQLSVAREAGLRIPETLVTNDPDEARGFRDRLGREMVYKAFTGVEEAWRETRLLRDDEVELLGNVRYTPVIFQEYVPAQADLRVTIIGEGVFAAEIDSPAGAYGVDVRMDMTVECRRAELPEEVERGLLRLMDTFGLEYGAVDMRRTSEGEHVFLEINPAGQYLYIEKLADIPLSRALAEHLARGQGRRALGNYPGGGEETEEETPITVEAKAS